MAMPLINMQTEANLEDNIKITFGKDMVNIIIKMDRGILGILTRVKWKVTVLKKIKMGHLNTMEIG